MLHIQFTLFSAFYTPLILTMAGGFLEREGLKHSWSVAPAGTSAIKALESGEAQVIQSAPSQAFSSLAKGETPLAVHFGQINAMDGFFISAREPHTGGAAKPFDWRQLEGRKVVMFGGGQPNAMFRYACHRAGIDFDRIEAITYGGADAIDQAFRNGEGDFVQQQGPYPQQLEQDQMGHIVATVGPQIGINAFSSLAATREWLDTDEATAFTRAFRAAKAHLCEHDSGVITDTIAEYFPDTNPQALKQCIAAYQTLGCWRPEIEITPEGLAVVQDVFEHCGQLQRRFGYEEVCARPPG